MNDSQDNLAFLRPYTPDLFGLLSKLRRDHRLLRRQRPLRARRCPPAQNIFTVQRRAPTRSTRSTTNRVSSSSTDLDSASTAAAPGGGTQQAADLSNPFLDDGNLGTGRTVIRPTFRPAHEKDRPHRLVLLGLIAALVATSA